MVKEGSDGFGREGTGGFVREGVGKAPGFGGGGCKADVWDLD